jgi:hypothetical protein
MMATQLQKYDCDSCGLDAISFSISLAPSVSLLHIKTEGFE